MRKKLSAISGRYDVIGGGFFVTGYCFRDTFKEPVIINGASAIVGIAGGKIEAVSGNIFNNGKIVIPFVNIVDYYKNRK